MLHTADAGNVSVWTDYVDYLVVRCPSKTRLDIPWPNDAECMGSDWCHVLSWYPLFCESLTCWAHSYNCSQADISHLFATQDWKSDQAWSIWILKRVRFGLLSPNHSTPATFGTILGVEQQTTIRHLWLTKRVFLPYIKPLKERVDLVNPWKMTNGRQLLVHFENKTYSENFLYRTEKLIDIPIKDTLHKSLNYSRCRIKSEDLATMDVHCRCHKRNHQS